MLKPQYITKIVNPNTNKVTVMEPEVVGNPVTEEAAKQVREYMRDTTENEEYGIAYGKYNVPGYHVSVKTGTAQISENGAYLKGENDYIYSAVSMVPSENPEYIFYLTIKQPKKYDYNALSDITNAILKRAMDLTSSDASTDGSSTEPSTEKIKIDDYRNLATTTAATAAQKSGLDPIVLGEGSKVKSQSIEAGKTVLAGEKLLLLTNDDAVTMPDITGWSKTDILKLTDLLKIDVKFEGEGYATSQNIEAYSTVGKQKLTVVLKENQ
jgi:penicillin-binding protein 2X